MLFFSSSSNCSFHVCVPSEPVLIGKNENIKMAPYYTWYPQLEKDMKLVGVQSEPNYWNLPIVLGKYCSEETNTYSCFKGVNNRNIILKNFSIMFNLRLQR